MSFFFGSGKKTQANSQTAASGLQIQSSCYGKPIPILFGINRVPGNLIWYGDFKSISHESAPSGGGGKGGGGGGGGGKGGGGGGTTYTYTTSVAMGLCEGPSTGPFNVFADKTYTTMGYYGFTNLTGPYPQTPWGYLTTKHPTEALGYNGVCYAAVGDLNLGNSSQLPNFNFEVAGLYFGYMSNSRDCDPTYVLSEILISERYGIDFLNFAAGVVSYDFTNYQKYVRVYDLGISPAILEQQACSEIFNNIVKNTNSEFVWSGNTLTIVPYGDETKTAHGYTYTAPSAPIYNLTNDDFIEPIKISRKRASDVINSIKLECFDYTHSYNSSTIEAKDQSLIDLFGLRQDSQRNGHIFCDVNTAKLSVQLQLQREQVRNTYTFSVSQKYILLDPMDIISITDSYLGLSNQWVRIKDITEDADGNLSFVCEEYLSGNGTAALYDLQAGDGFTVNYSDPPGSVNTPVIFDAPVQLNTEGQLETWLAVSGADENWGGCTVYVSADGNTYKQAGRITGRCRQGLLTSTFPSGSDPDVTNDCDVNLTQSFGELLSGTQDDADLGHTLCYVDGELIAYKTATLTGLYNYTLGDYIRRGMYGTTISSHSSGTQFARLDGGIFTYPYDKTQIGKTIYVKFLSFNIYGGADQSLADVSPYTHIITGPPAPPNVTGFAVTQNGGATVFTWNEVEDFALKGYDILYGPQNEGINTATFLTQSGRGTEMTNAAVPTGAWTFYIRARDVTDRFSLVPSTFNATIVSQSSIIYQEFQEPDWSGSLVNLVKHYSGVLIPLGTADSDTYVQISEPASPTLSETPGGSLMTDTYYVQLTYINAYGSETTPSVEDSFLVADDNLLVVSSPSTLTGATGYNVYVGLTSGSGTLQNPVPYAIGSDWTLPTGGLVSGDALPTHNDTGWEVFDIFVVDPVSSATYTSPEIDSEFNDTLKVWATTQAAMGPGQSGQTAFLTYIDTWLTGEMDPDVYTLWNIGFVYLRYLKARFTLAITAGSVPYITSFAPTADRAPKIQDVVNVVIAPGGTTVTFPERYHFPPYVEAFNAAPVALLVTETAITDTDFLCNVFNTSGVDVGGTINYRVTGE